MIRENLRVLVLLLITFSDKIMFSSYRELLHVVKSIVDSERSILKNTWKCGVF